MKIQKRFAVIGGVAGIIMVFSTLGIAGAFGGGFHHCHKDMSGFMLKRLDKKIGGLNLTPEQKTKYDELRARLQANLSAAKEDREKFREAVRKELAKETPDVAALTAMLKKKIGDFSGTLQNDLDLFTSFYSTLDEKQQHKVLAGISKRVAATDAHREEIK